MVSLITPLDLSAYGVKASDGEAQVVLRLIRAASDAVVDAAGSMILETHSTLTLLGGSGSVLELPGLPVRSVTSVTINGRLVDGWTVVPNGVYAPVDWPAVPITVEYVHGLPNVPEDIVALIVSMVSAGLLATREGESALALNNGLLSSFAIDDYKESYATGDDVEAVTPMSLTDRTKKWLAKRFGAGATVTVGR